MIQHSSAEVALTSEATTSISTNGKRIAKVVGAAALSFGLVGTFALPAYATVDSDIDYANLEIPTTQGLSTDDAGAATPVVLAVAGDVSEEALAEEEAAERRAAEEAEAEAAEDAEAQPAVATGPDIPSGAGAGAIAAGAMAQLGVGQDCTDLVQNSLAAAGITTRRDSGGPDLGTSLGQYLGLGGTQVFSGNYQPGDVLIWEGSHVAIYYGNGTIVHGGWPAGWGTAATSSFGYNGTPGAVVRF